MKHLLLLSLIFSVLLCSCNNKKTEGLKVTPNDPYDVKLLKELQNAVDDSTTSLSPATMDKMDLLLDTLYGTINNTEDLDSIRYAKSAGLYAFQLVTSRLEDFGTERIVRLTDKMLKVEYEFMTYENEEENEVIFQLINVFNPRNHDSDILGAFYDVYIHFDNKTGKCKQMAVILPDYWNDKDNEPVFIPTIKVDAESEESDISNYSLEYYDKCNWWVARIDGEEFEKIIKCNLLFLFTADDNDTNAGYESSCINLQRLNEQYTELLEKIKSKN